MSMCICVCVCLAELSWLVFLSKSAISGGFKTYFLFFSFVFSFNFVSHSFDNFTSLLPPPPPLPTTITSPPPTLIISFLIPSHQL